LVFHSSTITMMHGPINIRFCIHDYDISFILMPNKGLFSHIVNEHVEISYLLLNLPSLFVLHSVRQPIACWITKT